MAQNSIIVKNYVDVFEELSAGGAFYPGHLLALGSAGTVAVHAAAGENVVPMFAIEDALQGKGINDAFASTDKARVWIPQRGDQVYAILADGQNIAIGDFLMSNGDGMLTKYVTTSEGDEFPLGIVAQAVEAVDLSDSSGGESEGPIGFDKRIIVRIV